jgi:hypothetical protein
MKKPNPLLEKLRSRMDSEAPAPITASVVEEALIATQSPTSVPVQKKPESGVRVVPTAFSISDEDQSTIKSLRAWLLSQDIEATGSQIVRACIAAARRDQSFVDLVQTVRSTDGRRKK